MPFIPPSPTLFSWRDTITNTVGQSLPDVTVIVLNGTVGGSQNANTETQPGSPLATIYADPYGSVAINQSTAPMNTAPGQGTFEFWAASGYYVIQAYGPGIIGQLTYGIQIGGGAGGGSPTLNTIGNPVADSIFALGQHALSFTNGAITIDTSGGGTPPLLLNPGGNDIQIGGHLNISGNLNSLDVAGSLSLCNSQQQAVFFVTPYTGAGAPIVVVTPITDPTAVGIATWFVTMSGAPGAWTAFSVHLNAVPVGCIDFNYICIGLVS